MTRPFRPAAGRRPGIRLLALGLAAGCGACAPFPELDRMLTPEGRAAPPPRIEPLEPLLAEVPPPVPAAGEARGGDDPGAETRARADDLRAEAGRLGGAPRETPSRAEIEARRARIVREREALRSP